MPLPAPHRREVRANVKKTMAPQVCHCEAPTGPWQSREGTCSSYQLPLKWHAPIASVAALSERHGQLQVSRHSRRPHALPNLTVAAVSDRLVQSHSTAGGHWCTAALPDVSLRGAKRRGNLAVHSWITGRPRRKRNFLPEIATSAYGLLAMTNLRHSPYY